LHQETANFLPKNTLNNGFLDFSPLKRYNLATRTRSSMGVLRYKLLQIAAQDKRLTSKCLGEVNILFIGENPVYPLNGDDNNLSIPSIISILSTLIAPQLHQKIALQVDRVPSAR
jgi:hypothetical protein